MQGKEPKSSSCFTKFDKTWLGCCAIKLLYFGRGRRHVLHMSFSALDINKQSLQKVCPHGVVVGSTKVRRQQGHLKSETILLGIEFVGLSSLERGERDGLAAFETK